MPSIGKISGLCADYSRATYNGRPYDKIYEKILNGQDYYFNQMMKRGGIPCELGHPTDLDTNGNPRTDTDPTKIAVIITDIKKGGPQKLVASGEIMDTPNGRIYKELSKYYNFGLSSRGSYELSDDDFSEGPDGWNQDSYIFKGYDLVILPATEGSVVSVTEGVGSTGGKIFKAARESIDVNLLSKATQVSEDEVNEALDQLFKVDEKAQPGEEVTVHQMKETLEEEKAKKAEEEGIEQVPQEDPEAEEKPAEGEEIDTTLITNGDEVEKIKADLQTALDQIQVLTQDNEEKTLELSNRDAEVLQLNSKVEDLQSELDERILESEELVEKFETLKELSSKLLESYKLAKDKFEAEQQEPSPEDEEAAERLADTERERDEAQEELEKQRRVVTGLKGELAVAKESLIEAYSMSLGVSPSVLKNSLGKNYSVKKIKPAAEALANQTAKFSDLPIFTPQVKRSTRGETLVAGDEVERELIDLIKNQE